ncbi:PREDICTED: ubiquitin carboxyl-terminal hydrolase 17-like isoform X1 [Camelina sativa]|uniref:Ubiquitin carboxyl-terminal hydrolase 17-like isoform X1 n=1 Tax=Camelina sativa TaxID=90675 RepID=A0ABM0XDM9_CAMSA|nr:PREDICTED: ubiquitin carboxyl-terminal hydrolase 17-like isoform X1 [Camelina sativa]
MPETGGVLGFRFILIGFILLVFLLIRRQWRSASVRRDQVIRLIALATEESHLAEEVRVRSPTVAADDSVSDVYRCAVCLYPTSTRCAKCKSVRYCSSKCQILHWRRGHKDECRSPSLPDYDEEEEREDSVHSDDAKESHFELLSRMTGIESSLSEIPSNDNGKSVDVSFDMSTSRPSIHKVQATSEAVDFTTSISKKDDNLYETRPLSRKKSRYRTEKVESARKNDAKPRKIGNQNSRRSGDSAEMSISEQFLSVGYEEEMNALGHGRITSEPSSASAAMSSSTVLLPLKPISKPKVSQGSSSSGLKTSVQKVVQHFRPPKSSNICQPSSSIDEMSFSYDLFVKLYCDGVELQPFGLVNLGNSCYANAVLQCLAFTRPLISYLIRGLHSKTCRKKSWCFVCEFEYLILKARGGESPLSPIKILSKLQKIGKQLGPGKEEDAHEFLRCAVDTMQSVFLKEADAAGPFAEETTLVGLTFGGYLHSKIKCMKCLHKSERSELMMDLTVEIDGDIGSLEEALAQFTAYEVLDGENRYFCGRCKSYQKAKKKLMILEGPNILNVVLKRFQSDNFGKLSKPIHFPELLDISPYMSDQKHGEHPVYSLYAVVVHLDAMSTSFSGHYVCYIKTLHGDWFKIDDSNVFPVQLETVLLEGAYMLLYARDSPRPLSKNGGGRKSKGRRSLAAIPSTTRHGNKQRDSLLPRVDSSSGSLSSLFSSSDTTSSCSTKDSSGGIENLSDYLFGEVEPVWKLDRRDSSAQTFY